VDDSSNQVRMMVVQDATAQTGTKDHAALNFYYENAGSVLDAGSTPLFRIQQGTTDNTTGAITTAKKVQFDGQTIAEDQSGTATVVADCAPATLTVADTPVALTGTATLTHDGTTVINSSGKIPAARLAEHDGSALDLTGIDFTAADITCGNLTASGTITRVNEVNTDVTDRAPRFGTGSEGAALSTNDSKDRALVLETYTDETQNAALVLPTKASGTIDEVEIRANVDPTSNSVGGDLAKIKASNFVDSNGDALLDGSDKIPFSRLEDEPALLNGASGENFAMAAGSAASLSATGEIDAATFDASSGYKVGASTVIDSSSNFSGGTIDGSTITASTHVETPSIGNTGSTLTTVSSIIPSGSKSVGTTGSAFTSMYTSTMYTNSIYARTGDDVQVNGHLVPVTDDNNSLGTASKQFSEAHVAGAVDAGSYEVGGVSAIDASRNFSGAAGSFTSVATGSLANGGSAVDVGDALVPDVSATHDLGSATYKWADLHASGAADVGSLEIGGTEVIDSSRNVSVASVTSLGYVSAASVTGSTNVQTVLLQGVSNSDVSLGNNLVPSTDGAVDIGSSSKKVGTVYADSAVAAALANEGSSISLGDSLIPDADGTLDLGSSGNKMGHVYSDAVTTDALNLSGDLSVSTLTASVGVETPAIDNGGSSISLGDSLIPDADGTLSLGSSSYKLNEVHAGSVQASTLTSAGNVILGQERGSAAIRQRMIIPWSAVDTLRDSGDFVLLARAMRTRPDEDVTADATYSTSSCSGKIKLHTQRLYHEFLLDADASAQTPGRLEYIGGSHNSYAPVTLKFVCCKDDTTEVTQKDFDDYLLLKFQADGTWGDNDDTDLIIDFDTPNCLWKCADGNEGSGYKALGSIVTITTPRVADHTSYDEAITVSSAGAVTLATDTLLNYETEVDTTKVIEQNEAVYQPRTDNAVSLGTSSKRFANVYTTSLYSSNDLVVTSDARKKRAIEEIEEVDYRPLKARRFEMIEFPGRQRAGFIAQEVQEIMPEAVTENDGVLGIDPVAISGHMWNRVDRLEAKLDALIDSMQQ